MAQKTPLARDLLFYLLINKKREVHYKMQATSSVQIFKKIHNVVEKDLHGDSMFFFKGAIIGGILSLFLWAMLFWVIT